MRKLITVLLAIVTWFTINAAAPADSCIVYGYLRWSPSAIKYSAKLELGPGRDLENIMSAKGEKLKFQSFLNALNYMSSQGWDVVEISKPNPEHNSFTQEQYAIIRKKMSKDEAAPFASPKN